jgi:hypothetical protein
MFLLPDHYHIQLISRNVVYLISFCYFLNEFNRIVGFLVLVEGCFIYG